MTSYKIQILALLLFQKRAIQHPQFWSKFVIISMLLRMLSTYQVILAPIVSKSLRGRYSKSLKTLQICRKFQLFGMTKPLFDKIFELQGLNSSCKSCQLWFLAMRTLFHMTNHKCMQHTIALHNREMASHTSFSIFKLGLPHLLLIARRKETLYFRFYLVGTFVAGKSKTAPRIFFSLFYIYFFNMKPLQGDRNCEISCQELYLFSSCKQKWTKFVIQLKS